MKLFKLLTLAALCLCVNSLFGQDDVIDRSTDKAADKTNDRIDTRIDQGLEKGLDSIEGLFKRKKKKNTEQEKSEEVDTTQSSSPETEQVETESSEAAASMMSGMFQAAEWKDTYTFDVVSDIHMTSTSKKGKTEASDVTMMLGKDCMAMAVRAEGDKEIPPVVVFDYENHSFITLTEDKGKKEGFAMAMNKDQLAAIVEETTAEEMEGLGFTKTGRTKSILGYNCNQYTFSDEDMEGEMWLTKDIDIEMSDIFSLMTSTNRKQSALPSGYPEGYLMEMNGTDKKKGDTTSYLVISLKENAGHELDMNEYNVMDPMQMMKAGSK